MRFPRNVTMLIRSLLRFDHTQESINRPYRNSQNKRNLVTNAFVWSTYWFAKHQVMSISSNTNPGKNRTKVASTYADPSALQSNIFSSEDLSSRVSKNISSNLIWHHITEPIGSTQDEIRKILKGNKISSKKAVAVVADIQLEGRGTQGRRWEMGDTESLLGNDNRQKDNNLYLTVGIPLDRVPITITLLPLQIGVLVAERVSHLIKMCQKVSLGENPANNLGNDTIQFKYPKVTVKWPNDVLVDQRKISGTLIETEVVSFSDSPSSYGASWMLIGIGVNVATAPRNLMANNSPGKHIRPPCCIQDFCDPSFNKNDGIHATKLPSNTALILGQDIASTIADWVLNESMVDKNVQEERLVQQWRSFAEWGVQYELRGRVVDEEQGGYEGERVTTLDIERDGQLRVRGADGRERLLVADYLF